MKQLVTHLIIATIALWSSSSLMAQEEAYHIRVKIDNYENDTCILGYHMGKQIYVQDTLTKRNAQGEFEFKGDQPLDGGMYLVLTKPNNIYFDFLVANEEDQKDMVFTTKLEGNDLNKNLKVQNSKPNDLFYGYLQYLNDQRAEDGKLAKAFEAEKDEAKKQKIKAQRVAIEEKVRRYQLDLAKNHPKSLTANLILASMPPKVPEGLTREQGFYYYRARFWNNFDWSDERLIRTNAFKSKIENWTENLTVKSPDSMIVAVDYILQNILKAGNKKMFRFGAAELLNKYAKTKVICMDAVYVFIGKKYYCSGNGLAEWVGEEQLEKICENVTALEPLQCGLQAPDIRLKKMDGTPINLYDVKAKFVALYFWDPDCGNCSKTTDKLVPVYNEYKDKGFEVFGICSKTWKEIDKCKSKIASKKMDFINVSDETYPLAVVKKRYDIKVNPYLILLDENKKILWKRLDPNQIRDILKREFTEEQPKN
ncbi:MAG: redoxin domain-containing protein [Aureispira sp.]